MGTVAGAFNRTAALSQAMYESIDVWRRSPDGSLRRYRCLRSLASGQYCVQSMDVLRLPIDAGRLKEMEIQFHQLLAEADPIERSGGFLTLEEAIADHNAAFGTAG